VALRAADPFFCVVLRDGAGWAVEAEWPDVAKRLTAVVADDEACAVVFDVPGRREAAICHRLSQSNFRAQAGCVKSEN